MQIVHNFKETHFGKVLLEQTKYVKIFWIDIKRQC